MHYLTQVALLGQWLYDGGMNNVGHVLYNVVLSLWIGGIAIFTFIATPAIFRSFEKDMAGKIVGKLFPGYFVYNTALSVLAFILLLVMPALFSKFSYKLSMGLVICAVVINLFIAFKLHPAIKQVKKDIHSFETPAEDSPLRKTFGKLHAISASLNLLLLADGITLLVISSMIKRQ